jgi:hypothetical protein
MDSYMAHAKRETFKEVISIWSDQSLPQGENWPKEDNMTEEYRKIKKRRLEASGRSRQH